MTIKESFRRQIRGWFPQEPLIGNKRLQIKLETNPLKLKQLKAKFTINTAQFIAVILSVGLILSGLYLNAIYTVKDESSLPVSGSTYYEPFEFEGNTYNCCIHLTVPPKIRDIGLGSPNVAPIYGYINQPTNLTSGVYIARLFYLSYNASLGSYISKEINETRTFSIAQTTRRMPSFSLLSLHIPFEQGQSRDHVITDAGFTICCNATGELKWPIFTITTPLDSSEIVYNYPYRNYANILLALGVISLISASVISFVNLRKKGPNSLNNVLRS